MHYFGYYISAPRGAAPDFLHALEIEKIVRTLSPLPPDTSTGEVSWGYSHQPQSYLGSHAEF